MPKYFGRQYRIEVNNHSFVLDSREQASPLQIYFMVDTSFGGAVSNMQIDIYGLSNSSINRLSAEVVKKESPPISLQAGYKDLFGPIFYGNAVNMHTTSDLPERKTTLYCWTGAGSQKKACEVSFAPGSKYSAIVKYIANDYFGRPAEYIGFSSAFEQSMGVATDGYNALDCHKELLDKLAKDCGFEWMARDGKCLLMARGSNNGGEVSLIDYKSGLVGPVSLSWMGVDIETKLNPKIGIGDRLRIESKSTSLDFSDTYHLKLPQSKTEIGAGIYTVKKIKREGSFYGDNTWSNFLECWREGEKGLQQ